LSSYNNLGIAYNAGTGVFSVTSASGRPLSFANPGHVTLPSKSTPGELITYPVTADQSFIDDVGASNIIGNLFGFTTGVAVAVNTPFFIYAVSNDSEDTIAFMIGRTPHKSVSPAAANIGVPGTPGANNQTSLFSLSAITTTEYDGNPCTCIGAFRMQMSTSDDWTVQTISTSDGMGRYLEETLFTTPRGHWGANANTYFIPNGGTAATWNSQSCTYTIKRDGTVFVVGSANGDAGADGAGAVNARFAIPFNPNRLAFGVAFTGWAGGAPNTSTAVGFETGNFMQWAPLNNNYITWATYGNGNRTFNAQLTYTSEA
jgi:hypothetical protein